MDGFLCPRCGYATPLASHIRRHLTRKHPCKSVYCDLTRAEIMQELFPGTVVVAAEVPSTFECATCHKKFSSRQALCVHGATKGHASPDGHCSNTQGRKEGAGGDGDVRRELAEVRSVLGDMQARTVHINQSNCNVTHVTNNISVVNAFGHETVEHITPNFLDQCVRRTDKGLVELIEKLHFDASHQENCNLKITNVKLPIMQVHDGHDWKYDRKDKVLNTLVDRGHGMMQEHFDDHEERIRTQMSETMFTHIQRWMDKVQDRDKKTLESVLIDIYVLILNSGATA